MLRGFLFTQRCLRGILISVFLVIRIASGFETVYGPPLDNSGALKWFVALAEMKSEPHRLASSSPRFRTSMPRSNPTSKDVPVRAVFQENIGSTNNTFEIEPDNPSRGIPVLSKAPLRRVPASSIISAERIQPTKLSLPDQARTTSGTGTGWANHATQPLQRELSVSETSRFIRTDLSLWSRSLCNTTKSC